MRGGTVCQSVSFCQCLCLSVNSLSVSVLPVCQQVVSVYVCHSASVCQCLCLSVCLSLSVSMFVSLFQFVSVYVCQSASVGGEGGMFGIGKLLNVSQYYNKRSN